MPWYIQRKAGGRIETIDEVKDSREAHKLAAEYNLADNTATHYVVRTPCKAWRES